MSHKIAPWLIALFMLACAQGAAARSSDRNQDMIIDAGRSSGTLDDSTPTVLSGGVQIDQGTLHVESSKAVLTTSDGEISSVLLTGSPVRLEQQLDDGTPMNAVASKVDYDMQTQVVVFSGEVRIEQPRGTLSGDRVVYNMRTGQVTSGGENAGRVRMRIMPDNNAGATGSEPADEPGQADDAGPEPEVDGNADDQSDTGADTRVDGNPPADRPEER